MREIKTQKNSNERAAGKFHNAMDHRGAGQDVAPITIWSPPFLQRKAACACGGDCPTCSEFELPENLQTKSKIRTRADPYEQEADRVADQVMRMPVLTSPPSGTVQRTPTLEILAESFIGPPSSRQRRAARSCPINCCVRSLGTLHSMPLQQQQGYGAIVPPGSSLATGIGAALHFVAADAQPADGLCHCDDFRIIQVVESNVPADPRGNSFVDNDWGSTPFYGDAARGGRGESRIPRGYRDAGETVDTTESIYDRPYRDPSSLAALRTNFSWMAESCVTCIKNNEADRVLGCATYGFTRAYNRGSRSFSPIVEVSPGCLSQPTNHFVSTLRGDIATNNYDFHPAPGRDECWVGDFPTPRENPRVAQV